MWGRVRRLGVGLLGTVLAMPMMVAAPAAQAAGGAVVGGKVRVPEEYRDRVVARVVNANRATVVASVQPGARYRLEVPPGLYLIGVAGSPGKLTARYTHAVRFRRGERHRIDLPPRVSWRAPSISLADRSPRAPRTAARPVVSVGPVTVQSVPGFDDGTNLWQQIQTDLFLSTPCKVDYTDPESLAIAKREVKFQKSRYVDASTRVKPNFVIPTSQVRGTITGSGDQATLSLSQVDLASGQVRASHTVTGPLSSFLDLLEQAARGLAEEICRPRFPEGWNGTSSGTIVFPMFPGELTESWSASYVLRRDRDVQGVFYRIDSGTMTWSLTGTAWGCQWSAGPVTMTLGDGPPLGFGHVWIDPVRGSYEHGLSPAQAQVTGTVTCPDGTSPFFRVPSAGGYSGERPWEEGMTVLSGSVEYPAEPGGAGESWEWKLTAT